MKKVSKVVKTVAGAVALGALDIAHCSSTKNTYATAQNQKTEAMMKLKTCIKQKGASDPICRRLSVTVTNLGPRIADLKKRMDKACRGAKK